MDRPDDPFANAPPDAIGAAIKRKLASRRPDVIVELSDFQKDIRNCLTPERLMAKLALEPARPPR
jgi:hypothetical protein